ncbi:MAG: hypothetical protein KAI64_00950, partial [Thermoplasmata archaeon]|nr:hypothetical protein [Thermoplasmata archaeon]
GGDLRSAVNDLEAVAEGKNEILDDDLTSVGFRDPRSKTFDVLTDIFKSMECKKPRESMNSLEERPDWFILWVDENLPLEYRKVEDLSSGFDRLSRADVFLGRVKRRQYYRFWAYASDLMTAGVAMAKKERYSGFTPYRFPMWLIKMSRSKAVRGTTMSIAKKIMSTYHMSRDAAVTDFIPYLKYLYIKDDEFRSSLTTKLDLIEREIAHLLDKKEDSHEVVRLAALKSREKEKTIEIFKRKRSK